MKNKIDDLRNHLFETLEALRDPEKPMELDRAKVIANVAQTIINSAKVECEFMEITGSKGSGFIPQDQITGPDQNPIRVPRLAKG